MRPPPHDAMGPAEVALALVALLALALVVAWLLALSIARAPRVREAAALLGLVLALLAIAAIAALWPIWLARP